MKIQNKSVNNNNNITDDVNGGRIFPLKTMEDDQRLKGKQRWLLTRREREDGFFFFVYPLCSFHYDKDLIKIMKAKAKNLLAILIKTLIIIIIIKMKKRQNLRRKQRCQIQNFFFSLSTSVQIIYISSLNYINPLKIQLTLVCIHCLYMKRKSNETLIQITELNGYTQGYCPWVSHLNSIGQCYTSVTPPALLSILQIIVYFIFIFSMNKFLNRILAFFNNNLFISFD